MKTEPILKYQMYPEASSPWTTVIQGAPTSLLGGTGARGRIVLWHGTNSLSSDEDLFWDQTNRRMGIGTIVPASVLDVAGQDAGEVVMTIRAQTSQTANLLEIKSGTTMLVKSTSSGDFESGAFVHLSSGWQLGADGAIEAENARIRGEFRASTFAYDEVHANSGDMLIASASVLAADCTLSTPVAPTDDKAIALFSADVTDIEEGATVTFTSACLGGAVIDYLWDVDGDGEVEYITEDCSHVYLTEGDYTVTLTVTSAGGTDSHTKTAYIHVVPTPVVIDPVEGSLVHQWTFDEGGGIVVYDTGPASYNLTVGTPSAVTWGDGYLQINSEVMLEGDGADGVLSSLVKTTNEFSIDAWVTPDTASHRASRIIQMGADYDNVNFALLSGDDRFSLRLRSMDSSVAGLPSFDAEGTRTATKTHIAFTCSSAGAWVLYQDSVAVDSGSLSAATDLSTWDDTYGLMIGNGPDGGRPFLGRLYVVRVYNKELSAAEVLQNFNAEGAIVEPSYTPAVAVYSIDDTSIEVDDTATFTDASTGDVATYEYHFGAGEGTSTLQSPTHQYTTAGTFATYLKVVGMDGDSNTSAIQEIQVNDPAEPPPEPPTGGYHVATNGSNSNAGTSAAPWRTVQYGVSNVPIGQWLYIHGGTYHELVVISRSGTSASNQLKVGNYASDTVVIDGEYTLPTGVAKTDPVTGRTFNYNPLVSISGSYVTLDGCNITRSGGMGIYVTGDHVTIQNCNSYDNRHRGIQAINCSYPMIDGCYVYGNGNWVPRNRGLELPWCSALIMDVCEHGTIQNCHVYHNYGEGINLRRGSYYTVQDTISGMNMRVGIYIDQSHHSVCQRNFVYGAPASEFLDVSPPCLSLGQENERIGWYNHDNLIINNICVGGSRLLNSVSPDPEYGYLVDTTIANNVFYEVAATGVALRLTNHAANSGSVFRNNIIVTTRGQVVEYSSSLHGVTFDHNCWYGTQPPLAYRSGSDVTTNPLLESPDAYGACAKAPTRYRITYASPCRGAGLTIASVTEDYWETARPQGAAYDIGAHEYA